jgi:hypothetical protein
MRCEFCLACSDLQENATKKKRSQSVIREIHADKHSFVQHRCALAVLMMYHACLTMPRCDALLHGPSGELFCFRILTWLCAVPTRSRTRNAFTC